MKASFVHCVVICWLLVQVHAQKRDPICLNVPHGHFVRGSQSCKAFNYCANGEAYAGTCPTSLSFNAQREICDHEERVDCVQCSAHGVQNIADPRDCSKFYRCVRGFRTARQCPAGLMFDTRLGDCNVDANSVCQVQVSICDQFSEMGVVYIGNPSDCTRYLFRFRYGQTFRTSMSEFLDILCATTVPSRIFNAARIHFTIHRPDAVIS